MSRSLQTNQLVKVRAEHEKGGTELEGVVLDASGAEVLLAFPDNAELPQEYGVGAPVTLKTWDQLGLHFGSTRVLRHLDQLAMGVGLAVARPASYATMQRRATFRVPARLPFAFKVCSAEKPSAMGRGEHTGTTDDVSAGGMRFQTDLPLSVGDEIEMTITFIAGTPPIFRKARIVRTSEAAGGRISVGVNFVGASDTERIIDELFHVQRRTSS